MKTESAIGRIMVENIYFTAVCIEPSMGRTKKAYGANESKSRPWSIVFVTAPSLCSAMQRKKGINICIKMYLDIVSIHSRDSEGLMVYDQRTLIQWIFIHPPVLQLYTPAYEDSQVTRLF